MRCTACRISLPLSLSKGTMIGGFDKLFDWWLRQAQPPGFYIGLATKVNQELNLFPVAEPVEATIVKSNVESFYGGLSK